MPCYHPMPAVRMSDGTVKFGSRNKRGVESTLELPCGQCVGCRLERSRQWAMRCLHESSLYDQNCFITLTYSDDFLPEGGTLKYKHFQDFMKRLRKKVGPVRFYMGAEYGEKDRRPHYHACIFGYDFPDRVYFKKSPSGDKLYRSKILEGIWTFGNSLIGNVTFESAAYIARYCVQKVTGQKADEHYRVVDDDGVVTNLVPEFNRMSLKPGIGARWLEKYRTDVYPRDYVVINGVKTKPPKYYDKLFEKYDAGEFSEIVASRELDMANLKLLDPREFWDERLAVKETVHKARSAQLKRNLDDNNA